MLIHKKEEGELKMSQKNTVSAPVPIEDLHESDPDCDTIAPVGLIFLATETPEGRLHRTITESPFDQIGFYYSTSLGGCEKVRKVVIKSLIGSPISAPFRGGDDDPEIGVFFKHPLVKKMHIYPLKPRGEYTCECLSLLVDKMLMAIANHRRDKIKTDPKEILYQLFGHPVKTPGRGVTPVEFVNRVIDDIDMSHAIPQGVKGHCCECEKDQPNPCHACATDKLPEELENGVKGLLDLISVIGSNFSANVIENPNTANKLIKSYLSDCNCLFTQCIRICLPPRDCVEVTKALAEHSAKVGPQLNAMASSFVQLMSTNPEFVNTVIGGVNRVRRQQQLLRQLMCDAASGMGAAMIDLVTELNHAVAGPTPATLDWCKVQKALFEFNVNRHIHASLCCEEVCDIELEDPTAQNVHIDFTPPTNTPLVESTPVLEQQAEQAPTEEIPYDPVNTFIYGEDAPNELDVLAGYDIKKLSISGLRDVGKKIQKFLVEEDDAEAKQIISEIARSIAERRKEISKTLSVKESELFGEDK